MTPSGAAMAVYLLEHLRAFAETAPQPVQETQIDQQVDQRIAIGNRRAVAEMWSFDAKGNSLRIDPLTG